MMLIRSRPFCAMAMLLLTMAVFAGCQDNGQAQSNLPTVTMKLGNENFVLEVADNDKAREIGLMNRDSMPADHGMIFMFPTEERRNFWMKNTRIPLDIVFLSRDARVVSIKQMQPFDLRSTSSGAPAQFAIELNVGAAARAGMKVGDQVQLRTPSSAPATTRSSDNNH